MKQVPRLAVLLTLGFAPSAHAAGGPVAGAAQPPDWLRQAASVRVAEDRSGATVLLDEQVVTVQAGGIVRATTRYAVRVQTRAGRDAAALREVYLTDGGRVRDIRAWSIPASGDPIEYGKDRALDFSLAEDDVYNEVRVRAISAGRDAEPGVVFGAEVTSESRMPFGHFEWTLQGTWPVKLARRTMIMPSGWEAASVTFNHDAIAPAVNGTSYTWEARDLGGIELEPLSPSIAGLAARLAVTCYPPAGTPEWPRLASWGEVSRWLAGLSERQASPDAAITAKARELTAGAASEIDRVKAIGRFVQNVRYISIQTGLGRGGGYQPRPAYEVFNRNYGDCKAKATLMRAMLSAIGVNARLVSIFSGDRTYVRENWPSPQQFNHVIVAVFLQEPYEAPAVLAHPSAGRMLLFDPTAEDTTVGHLPIDEQGSLALLVAPEGGALVRVPDVGSSGNASERTSEGTLAADGSFSVVMRDKSTGEAAAYERARWRFLSATEYRERFQSRLAGEFPSATIRAVSGKDDREAGSFELTLDATAPGYGRLIQGRLLVFKPPTFGSDPVPSLSSSTRKHPVIFTAVQATDTLRVALPDGFKVDEMPPAANIESSFGRFKAAWRLDGRTVVAERQVRLEGGEVSKEDYARLKDFLEKVHAAKDAPLVLSRMLP